MCFKPVKFCFSNRTILQTHRGFPFDLAPVTLAVEPYESLENVDASAGCNRLGFPDGAENFEFHDAEDILPGDSDGLTFFRSAARGLHVPATLTPEPTKHEARKRRANERPRVGCCEELARIIRAIPIATAGLRWQTQV